MNTTHNTPNAGAKTITIFLSEGNPNGIKEVELSNRIIKAILIPRAKLKESKQLSELEQPALYFLCEKNGEQVYIGESENFYTRAKNHDQTKDFWEVAIAFIAKDNSLEKSDVKYMESVAVEVGKAAKRYTLTNTTIPSRNNLHKFKIPIIEEFFADVKLLISALGYPVFDIIQTKDVSEAELWYYSARGGEAKGIYDENGFTLLAGSIFSPSETASYRGSEERAQVIKKHADTLDDGCIVLRENLTCNSPSYASCIVAGASSNGWTSWRNADGKTLDEVYRAGSE